MTKHQRKEIDLRLIHPPPPGLQKSIQLCGSYLLYTIYMISMLGLLITSPVLPCLVTLYEMALWV